MPAWQQTIAKSVTLSGMGLHTGAITTLVFSPAPPDSGYTLVRTDLPGKPELKPRPESVSRNVRGTTVSEHGVEVHTIEHVFAALAGLEIDNCRIELSALEPPIMDGSARPFTEALQNAGILPQPGHEAKIFPVQELTLLRDQGKELVAWPSSRRIISYQLDYPGTCITPQRIDVEITPRTFLDVIAPCRTFCFEKEINWLKSQGLAQGGSLENALVISEQGLMNPPFRQEHELAGHKVLDLIGDLALLGVRWQGRIVATRTGHEMNTRLALALQRQNKLYCQHERGKDQMIIEAKDIEKLLPHRYPMLLVDRIVDMEPGKRITGIKNVTMNEHFFQGHFPGHPIMPGVLIVEAMAQCGGVLLMKSSPDAKDKIVMFMAINNVKFRKPVLPGDQLRMELEVDKLRSKIACMKGRAFVGEDLVAEAELMSTVVDR